MKTISLYSIPFILGLVSSFNPVTISKSTVRSQKHNFHPILPPQVAREGRLFVATLQGEEKVKVEWIKRGVVESGLGYKALGNEKEDFPSAGQVR